MFTNIITRSIAMLACVVSTNTLFAASLELSHDSKVAALLQSGKYAVCQNSIPNNISGYVTWTCASTDAVPMICCLTSSDDGEAAGTSGQGNINWG